MLVKGELRKPVIPEAKTCELTGQKEQSVITQAGSNTEMPRG